MNAVQYFVRRNSDNRMLCMDGLWREHIYMTGCADRLRFYSSKNRAIKYCGEKDITVVTLYPNQTIDCVGNIHEWVTE